MVVRLLMTDHRLLRSTVKNHPLVVAMPLIVVLASRVTFALGNVVVDLNLLS
jgi:hypothetical protein